MTDAKSVALNQAFTDRHLSHVEVNELIKISFADSEAGGTVDQNVYLALKDTLQSFVSENVYSSAALITYENPDDRKRLQILTKAYPGNLANYLESLRAQGLAKDVDLNVQLPTITLNADNPIYQDSVNPDVIHLAFTIEGKRKDFAIDTTLPLETQDFYLENSLSFAVFDDVTSALDNMYVQTGWEGGATQMTTEEAKLNVRLSDFVQAQPQSYTTKSSIVADGDVSVFGLDERDTGFLKKLATAFPMPVDSDESLSDADVQSVVSEVAGIVGPEILAVLKETGLSFSFVDQKQLDEARQDNGAVHSDQSAIGVTEDGRKKITMDTNLSRNEMLWFLIHEMAHELDLVLQKSANAVPVAQENFRANGEREMSRGYNFVGAQPAEFVAAMEYEKTNPDIAVFGTDYSHTNDGEWFADNFTLYTLERAGRYDVIEQHPGVTSAARTDGLFAVHPQFYLVLAKIDQIIRAKNQNPKAYQDLLTHGMTEALFAQALSFCNDQIFRNSADQIISHEQKQNPEKFPPTLAKWLGKWAGVSLEKSVTVNPEQDSAAEFAKTVRDDFANRKDPIVQAQYLPDSTGAYPMQIRVDQSMDYKAVQLAVQLERATTSAEKIIVLIDYGIRSEEDFDFLLSGLTILDSAEVADTINPQFTYQATQSEPSSWHNAFGYWAPAPKIVMVTMSLVNQAHKEYARRLELADESARKP
jgi:hypothetical protein